MNEYQYDSVVVKWIRRSSVFFSLQHSDEVKLLMAQMRASNVTGPNSVRWVHILVLVLVDIVVEIVERLVALVPMQVDGV